MKMNLIRALTIAGLLASASAAHASDIWCFIFW